MARTVETTVYQFDELSDRAKERAADWYRQSIGQDFEDFGADNVLEDATTIAKLLGIRVDTRTVPLMGGGRRHEPDYMWEVGACRGTDGASFTGYYSYVAGSVRAVTDYAPKDEDLARIARALQSAQRRYFYRLQVRIDANRYYRGADSARMTFNVEYDGADYRDVDDRTVEDISQALRDFADWIGARLTAEWEYQHSDEVIAENIRANEYEFTEDGDRA